MACLLQSSQRQTLGGLLCSPHCDLQKAAGGEGRRQTAGEEIPLLRPRPQQRKQDPDFVQLQHSPDLSPSAKAVSEVWALH